MNLKPFRAMGPRYAEAFWERLADHPNLADRVAGAHPASEVFAFGPTPSYMRRAARPGVVLVGDAGIHLDPWTGHGMDFAGRHACFAADAIAEVLHGGDETAAFSRYYDMRDEHALEDYEFTTEQARDLSEFECST